jgi:hypothetical protein
MNEVYVNKNNDEDSILRKTSEYLTKDVAGKFPTSENISSQKSFKNSPEDYRRIMELKRRYSEAEYNIKKLEKMQKEIDGKSIVKKIYSKEAYKKLTISSVVLGFGGAGLTALCIASSASASTFILPLALTATIAAPIAILPIMAVAYLPLKVLDKYKISRATNKDGKKITETNFTLKALGKYNISKVKNNKKSIDKNLESLKKDLKSYNKELNELMFDDNISLKERKENKKNETKSIVNDKSYNKVFKSRNK